MNLQTSGTACRENAEVCLHTTSPPSSSAKADDPVFRDARDGNETRGVLDTPPSRSMTAVGGAAASDYQLPKQATAGSAKAMFHLWIGGTVLTLVPYCPARPPFV